MNFDNGVIGVILGIVAAGVMFKDLKIGFFKVSFSV